MIPTLIIIHMIGAITTMIIHYQNRTFEQASKFGDGIRFAKPFDVVVLDCIAWEILLFLFIIGLAEEGINNIFNKK